MKRISLKSNTAASLGVRRGILPVALLAALAVLLVALAAFARAGGGQNYTGGGGGHSGGGGGGGGGDLFFLILLLVQYPQVGVPVLVLVGIVAIVSKVRSPGYQTRRAVGRLESGSGPSTGALAQIKERDPGFDEDAFIARATKTELAIQDAWSRGDMAPSRRFMSDGLHRRFAAQLAIMKGQGVRNALAEHAVTSASIFAAETGSHFDALHVVFEAKAKDAEVPATLSYEEAMAKAGRASVTTWTEVWSFLRRPGAKTAEGEDAFGKCPACGAPLPDGGEAVVCGHCKALVNSGEHDWVLAEITQPEEWRSGSTGEVPGLAALAARDPAFNRQAAEDRASYVFWRWVEALATGAERPLAKCASPELRAQVADQAKAGPAKLFKTAVGSVDLVGCEAGAEGGRDRFHVRILWSSARSNKEAPVHAAHVLTLGRKAGARDAGALSHAHCPSCLGPLNENDAPTCDYCGAKLDAGDADWVLEAVRRPEEVAIARGEARPVEGAGDAAFGAWVPDMGNPRERMLLLMRMAAVVVADNQVTKEERKLLATCAKRWNVPLEAVEPILTGQVPAESAMTMKPEKPEAFFMGLVGAALIDGRVDKSEEKLLLDVAKNLEMPEPTARGLIASMTAAQKAAAR
jgi:hypothetical protein